MKAAQIEKYDKNNIKVNIVKKEKLFLFQEEQEVLEQWLYQLQKQKGLQLLLMEV